MHWYAMFVDTVSFFLFLSRLLVSRRSMSDEYMPEFHKGESVDVMEVKLAEGSTSPPDYLTESEVIELEKNGIGTDASIPTHINNICQRNYVQVGDSSTF
ncbi:hypothetical protein BC938DRAFT_474044 [Jimgerdemannia flammicorona]|uniref:DNA topoisomerase n=1 Tax=Jimgerdemannia flammicorona TaxID=994334 RepID=A0A433Q335_9FUNG|nr:hypothetical protein BC938DRAFT_474044 [Jimgerdemannia flammicorona]